MCRALVRYGWSWRGAVGCGVAGCGKVSAIIRLFVQSILGVVGLGAPWRGEMGIGVPW